MKFEHATGFKRSPNVSTYSARFYEGRYVVGKIVGNMTKSNVIGYIASFPIPEVIRGINATYLAAKSVNPDTKMKIVWVSTWFDPGKEADAAKTLIDQGADVIMEHTDSPAPVQVAQQRGVWAVGQASDMTNFGPKAHLTSIIDNWGPYYVARREGCARRNLEIRGYVGWLQARHGSDGGFQQGYPGKRDRPGEEDAGRHYIRQALSVCG